jgi:Serine/threonine protein kinase
MNKIFANNYEILKLIGTGGMSKVYLAQDINNSSLSALKIIDEKLLSDPEYLKRFSREIQISKNLTHPNIVSLIDYGNEGNTYYIIFEYIQGITLDKYLKTHKPTIKEIEGISLQILEGLSYAHSKGIIHRDIKPQNILITKDNHVKITDFGIAKAISSATITTTGAFIGSPAYISPEQAKGDKEIDYRSDIYSFGIVLYEMLSGSVPFSADTPWGLITKHINVPPDMSMLPRDTPNHMLHIISKSLAKDADNRFGTVNEIIGIIRGQSEMKKTAMVKPVKVQDIAVSKSFDSNTFDTNNYYVSRHYFAQINDIIDKYNDAIDNYANNYDKNCKTTENLINNDTIFLEKLAGLYSLLKEMCPSAPHLITLHQDFTNLSKKIFLYWKAEVDYIKNNDFYNANIMVDKFNISFDEFIDYFNSLNKM